MAASKLKTMAKVRASAIEFAAEVNPLSDFPKRLATAAEAVETRLAVLLDDQQKYGTPPRLLAAMRHAVLSGGKRFRPFLLMETASLFGLTSAEAVDCAAALECIHCYSLVHDDLPSMDNDELRRGHPTVWIAFDDWTAILAGDGLQTMLLRSCLCPHAIPIQQRAAALSHSWRALQVQPAWWVGKLSIWRPRNSSTPRHSTPRRFHICRR